VPTSLIIGLFLIVVASLGLLIKWEFRRAQRSAPPLSKEARRQLERRDEPGNTYVAPPDRGDRAFQFRPGRR